MVSTQMLDMIPLIVIIISGYPENSYLAVLFMLVGNLGERVEEVRNLSLLFWRHSEAVILTFVHYGDICEHLLYVRHLLY